MSTNSQLQKISPPKIRRIRHRNRLVAASRRLQGRQPALDNFLIREAARAIASPLRVLDTLAIIEDAEAYEVGTRFAISGGTSSLQATGMVTEVGPLGIVTGVKIIEPGQYTVNPGVAAATTIISGAGDGNLTVTTTLSVAVAGVTEAELLAAIEGIGTSSLHRNIGDSFDIQVDANYLRNPRQSSQTYLDAGVPIS
jgi:hypothetical protein